MGANTPIGDNGLGQAPEADLRTYLGLLGDLYRSGVTSEERPDVLQGFGGALALAAQDAESIRTRKALGFLNWPRTWAERETDARSRWAEHSREIAALAKAKGLPPVLAAEEYINDRAFTGLHVQSADVVRQMLTLALGQGSAPRWLRSLQADRDTWEHESGVMVGNWLGATVAGINELRGVDRTRAFAAGGIAGTLGSVLEGMGPGHYAPAPPRGWENRYDAGRTISPGVSAKVLERARELGGPLEGPRQAAAPQSRPKPSDRGTGGGRPSAPERGKGLSYNLGKAAEGEWIYPPPFPRATASRDRARPRSSATGDRRSVAAVSSAAADPGDVVAQYRRLKAEKGSPARGHEMERLIRRLGNERRVLQTPFGKRIVDAHGPGFVNLTGEVFDFEAKMYKGKVGLGDPRINEELLKDLYLKSTRTDYNPVWVFTDGAPTRGLANFLRDHGIGFQVW